MGIFQSSNTDTEEQSIQPNHLSEPNLNLLNSIFSNNSILNLQERIGSNTNQSLKKTKPHVNSFILNKESIKLERKYDEKSIFYIKFKYISFSDKASLRIFQNACFCKEDKLNSICSYKLFEDKVITIDLPSSIDNEKNTIQNQTEKEIEFEHENCYFDYDYLIKYRSIDRKYYDLVIEITSTINNQVTVHVSFINLNEFNEKDVKAKVESQKINIKGSWFNISSVFGMVEDNKNNNECEICYLTQKNIVFLPCKHSYCCDACAENIRKRGNWCPICRNDITDLLVIENN